MSGAATRRGAVAPVLLAAAVVIAGCASGPYSADVPLSPDAHRPAHAPFAYRVPQGWFDASAPGDSAGNLIWLVRGDYAATIAVREIRLDAETRRRMPSARALGELTLGLAAGSAAALVLTPLERVDGPGGDAYAFEQVHAASGDTTRIIVFRMEEAAYEVQALIVGGHRGAPREEVFSAQRRFVEALTP